MNVPTFNRRVVTSRTVQAAAQRLIANIHADVVATCADTLGGLAFDQAWVVDSDGRRYGVPGGGADFDPEVPPQDLPLGVPSDAQWWFPEEDWAPPSALKYRRPAAQGPPMEALPVGTVSGAGTGKLVPAGDAIEALAGVGAKTHSRVSAACQRSGGYRGWFIEKVTSRIAGRAVAVATKTVLGNALGRDRLNDPAHYISTRNWEAGKTIGRHAGFAAYYRFRGRPSLPYGEAKWREKARQLKRRKTNRTGKYKSGPAVYQTKRPRPQGPEYNYLFVHKPKVKRENKPKNPAATVKVTAKRLDHKRGQLDTWLKEQVEKLMEGKREEIGKELGKKAGEWLVNDAAPEFWEWVKRGWEGCTAQGSRGTNTLNTPSIP